MSSLWSNTITLPSFPSLKKDIVKTDVLIIGGGLGGILCAYQLEQTHIPYILVEANTICSGITKNTTAKITSQHGLIYQDLIHQYGMEKAQLYLDANESALEEYKTLCQTIPCDFEEKSSYVYSLNNKQLLEQELTSLSKLMFPAEYVSSLPLPIATKGGIMFPSQAQFHPLKFLATIAKTLHIYEHTKVEELINTTAITTYGKILSKNIIVATHFPFLNKHGSYFLKMYQHRSYVLALENTPLIPDMYVDESKQGLSFRPHQNYLLLGGGSHRTGKKGGSYTELRNFAKTHYPNAKEISHWATQDCITLDNIPYIGHYSKHTPNLYVITGFNKWGFTSALTGSHIICDMILEKQNPYAEVFSPSRSMLKPQLFINGIESTINLITPTKKRCPHLGCALKWNPEEHTFDCPCHGSRFTEQGKLIDNPATNDLAESNKSPRRVIKH